MKNKSLHSGQVALIMVLVMTVVSAVAVSMASRSTVETRIQQMNVENTEALLTAQAGLEESISQNQSVTGSLGTGQYTVSLDDTGEGSVTSDKINPGETLEINLEGATGVTGIKIYWKSAVIAGTPAVFISEVAEDYSTNYAYDTNGSGGFLPAASGGSFDGVIYTQATPVPISITPGVSKKLRITVLGSSAFLGIEPVGGQLPPQNTSFRSVADVASTSENSVKYGIEYSESKVDQLPSIFDYVLFSGGSIVQ